MGMVASAKTSNSVRINGIDPVNENAVTHLSEKLVEGEYFGVGKNRVIISHKLAKKLNVSLRSKVILTSQDVDLNIISGAYRVVGIFQTNNSIYDEGNIFVRNRDLQHLLGIGRGGS